MSRILLLHPLFSISSPPTSLNPTTTTKVNPLHSHLSLPSSPSTCLTQCPEENAFTNHATSVVDDLAAALQRCSAATSIRDGTPFHARIFLLGLSSDLYLNSQLLFFYFSCGFVDAARSIFDSMPRSSLNLFFWNIMIRAYTDSGHHEAAVNLFADMLSSGFNPNQFTFPFVLKSCSVLGLLFFGRQVHGLMMIMGFQHDVFAASALLDLYAKCMSLGDARKLFDRIPHRSLVTANSMISAYAQNGLVAEALRAIELLGNAVEVSSWNSLIAGCVRCGDGVLALEMLGRMLEAFPSPLKPNPATINTLLSVIPDLASLSSLKAFHAFMIRWEVLIAMDPVGMDRLISAITAGYAHHGCMVYSSRLLDSIRLKTSQLWNSVISGFIDSGLINEAFCFFRKMAMQIRDGDFETLSKVSLTLLLPECSPSSLNGLEIHVYAYRSGLEGDTSVNNALAAMYARRGDLELSKRVFERIIEKDIVSWNTMVSCYAQNHDFDQASKLFRQMHTQDVKPNEFTLSSILNGCGQSAALWQGMGIHGYMIKSGFSEDYNCVLQNSLMDMYGKCGCVEESKLIFDETMRRDKVSWNTIITCYSTNAWAREAILHFQEMQRQGWKPNRVTFIALLSACSRAGMVDEAMQFFRTMSSEYGLLPDLEHYACIVDALGRAGRLDEALQLIESMSLVPDQCVWGALLSGCRAHGNVRLAEVAARHLIELEPQHSGYWVLLSNIYANARRWDDVARVRAAMKDEGVSKFPGCSWIDVCGDVHVFFTADKSHERSMGIYATLNGLTQHLKVEGYVPFRDTETLAVSRTN